MPNEETTDDLMGALKMLDRLWPGLEWRGGRGPNYWEGTSPSGMILVQVQRLDPGWSVRSGGFSKGGPLGLDVYLDEIRADLAACLQKDLKAAAGPSGPFVIMMTKGEGMSEEEGQRLAEKLKAARETMDAMPANLYLEGAREPIKLHERPKKEANLEVLRVYADLAREEGATQEQVSAAVGVGPRAVSDARTKPGWTMPKPPFIGAVPVVSLIRGRLGVGWRDTRSEPRDFRQMPIITWPFCECSSPTYDDFRALGFAVEGYIDLPASEGWVLGDTAEVIGV